MRKLVIIATSLFAFVACEKENLIPDWFTPSGEMVVIGVGEDGTRVSLDYDGAKDNLRWAAGDILGIYCPEAASTAQGYAVCANIPATINALSDDKKSATIHPEIEYNAQTTSHTFYVYYPWKNSGASSVAGTPTLSGIQLPTTQDGDIAKSTITWASKTVTPTNGIYGRIDNIKLVTPFAYVRFCFASASETDKKVSSVTMEAVTGTETNGTVTITGSDNSAVFCGTYNVDLTKQAVSGSEGANYPMSGAVTFTATKNVITVNQTVDITKGSYDKSKGVLMHINSSNAFKGTGKYFKITVMFSDGTYAVTYKAAKNFEANHIYSYGFNADNLLKDVETETEIYVEPWHEIQCDVAFD